MSGFGELICVSGKHTLKVDISNAACSRSQLVSGGVDGPPTDPSMSQLVHAFLSAILLCILEIFLILPSIGLILSLIMFAIQFNFLVNSFSLFGNHIFFLVPW